MGRVRAVLLIVVLIGLLATMWWRDRRSGKETVSSESVSPPLPAQPAHNESQRATGLRPPTSEERAAMDASLINTGDVRPNRLGLGRINADRDAPDGVMSRIEIKLP